MGKQILLVEDQQIIHTLVIEAVKSIGDLTVAATRREAEGFVDDKNFDIIILDIMLPDGNGFDLCKTIREKSRNSETPILFLTSQAEIEDLERGFALGADDYLTKPFKPRELHARVSAKVRIVRSASQTRFVKGSFDVDLKSQRVYLKSGPVPEELNLTPTEFRLIAHFLQNDGHVFSRQELVKAVWGSKTHISDHTVDTHISSLRKKIGESAKYLKVVTRKGYCFDLSDDEK